MSTICYLFVYLIEAIIIHQYATSLFSQKYSWKLELTTLFGCYFLLFLFSRTEIILLNGLGFLLLNFLYLFIMYKIKWGLALFHSLLITAIMSICEFAPTWLISLVSKDYYKELFQPQNLLLLLVISKTLYYLCMQLFILFIRKDKDTTHNINVSTYALGLFPIASVIIVVIVIELSRTAQLSEVIVTLSIFSSLLLLFSNIIILVLHQYNQKQNSEYTLLQLALQNESHVAEYYKMLSLQTENQNILIHDIKKHLHSIKYLSLHGQHTQLSNYIDELLHSSALKQSLRVCDDDLMNAIMSRYQTICSEKNISFSIDIRSQTLCFLNQNDLTALFCNLMDNAIEAAEHCDNRFIDLLVIQKEQTPFTLVKLINSCASNPLHSHSGMLRSTKPDHRQHGYGLKSIKRAVENYAGDIQMYFDQKNSTFQTIILLKDAGI